LISLADSIYRTPIAPTLGALVKPHKNECDANLPNAIFPYVGKARPSVGRCQGWLGDYCTVPLTFVQVSCIFSLPHTLAYSLTTFLAGYNTWESCRSILLLWCLFRAQTINRIGCWVLRNGKDAINP